MQRSFNDLGSADALTPQARTRSSSMRKNADEMFLPSHYSPGLLDLHAFDTELLPEVALVYPFLLRFYILLNFLNMRILLMCHLLVRVCFYGFFDFWVMESFPFLKLSDR